MVIEPQFAAAGNFYEDGLAPARKDGCYGYIDTTGKYVLPPIYDYAHDFVQGFAKVYKRSGSVYINTKGKELFHGIEEIEFSPDTLLICRTKSGAYGVLDRNGNIIIDTVYGEIIGRYTGYFRVCKFRTSYMSEDTSAIMDNKGNLLYDFHCAFKSGDIRDGFAIQEYVKSPNVIITDIITVKGEKILTYYSRDFNLSYFGDSLVVLHADRKAHFRFHRIDTLVSKHSSIILNLLNRSVVFVPPTSDGLYFVNGIAICNRMDSTIAINANGEQLWAFYCQSKLEGLDRFNTAVINVTNANGEIRKGVVTRDGKFVIAPIYENLEMTRNPDYYSYTERVYNSTEPLETGFISIKSGKVAVIKYTGAYTKESFHFRSTITAGKQTYYNYDGKIIWQDTNDYSDQVDFYNIDYLQNMNYVPRRKIIRKPLIDPATQMKILWETSFSIADSFPTLKSKGFSLVIDQLDTIRNWSKKLYCTLTMFNNTDTSWTIPENCNSVHLIMQAKDEEGQWRDIEVNGCTGCVIERGYFTFPSGHFAKFNVPIYTGSIKTKLRIKADFLTSEIYSNEFEGSINPGQFTRLDYVNSEEW